MKKFALILAAFLLSSHMALAALSLDAAKQQGLVGEQPDGLIGAVAANTPDVAELVTRTNAERLAKYTAIAAKNQTEVAQVQAMAGQKLIDATPAGQYVMGAGGWTKK